MQPEQSSNQLVRGLTLPHVVSLVVGGVIGTGIFLKTATMSHYVQSPKWVLLAWFAAGVLSLMGALVYAEISRLVPKTGGEYAYLREAYGPAPAYMFGWMRVAIGAAGSIAAYAVGMTDFLFPLLESWLPSINKAWVALPLVKYFPSLADSETWGKFVWKLGPKQAMGVGVIMFLSLINCIGVRAGGRIQTFLTVIKVSGMLLIALGVLFLSSGASFAHLAPAGGGAWKGWSLFGMAMLQALWAYDGWNLMPMVAGEVRNPTRNVARALIFGMIGVFLIYLLLSFFYFYALPFEQILQAKWKESPDDSGAIPVATMVVKSFSPNVGWKLASMLFVLSSIGALNGSIMTSARVPFAMARDGVFFQRLGTISAFSKVPVWSIVAQAVWSSVIALSGSYDQITDAVLFAAWIFYGVTALGYLRLRMTNMQQRSFYRRVIVPALAVLFALVALALVINSCVQNPWGSLAGTILMLLGLPLYFVFRQNKEPTQVAA